MLFEQHAAQQSNHNLIAIRIVRRRANIVTWPAAGSWSNTSATTPPNCAAKDARHLARVLRAEPGQQYEISDGAGVYLAEIAAVEKERVIFRVVEALDTPPPPVCAQRCAPR
jgi:hypothetical protein